MADEGKVERPLLRHQRRCQLCGAVYQRKSGRLVPRGEGLPDRRVGGESWQNAEERHHASPLCQAAVVSAFARDMGYVRAGPRATILASLGYDVRRLPARVAIAPTPAHLAPAAFAPASAVEAALVLANVPLSSSERAAGIRLLQRDEVTRLAARTSREFGGAAAVAALVRAAVRGRPERGPYRVQWHGKYALARTDGAAMLLTDEDSTGLPEHSLPTTLPVVAGVAGVAERDELLRWALSVAADAVNDENAREREDSAAPAPALLFGRLVDARLLAKFLPATDAGGRFTALAPSDPLGMIQLEAPSWTLLLMPLRSGEPLAAWPVAS